MIFKKTNTKQNKKQQKYKQQKQPGICLIFQRESRISKENLHNVKISYSKAYLHNVGAKYENLLPNIYVAISIGITKMANPNLK